MSKISTKKFIVNRIKYKIKLNQDDYADAFIARGCTDSEEEKTKADMVMSKVQERLDLLNKLLKQYSK